MSSLADLKYEYFKTAIGLDGTLADLEMAFLEEATGQTGSIADLEMAYYGSEGSLADRKMSYFSGLVGDSGTLTDLEYKFYSDLELQLEAIAGKPAGMQIGPGVTAPLAGFTAFGDRTLYCVYDAIAVGTNAVICALGVTSKGNIDFTANTNQTNWSTSFRTLNQPTAFRSTVNSGIPGRHVKVASVYAGLTSALYGTLDAGTANTSLVAGGGMDDVPPLILQNSSGAVGLIAAAYPAVHTEYQRTAIMRKLLQMSEA